MWTGCGAGSIAGTAAGRCAIRPAPPAIGCLAKAGSTVTCGRWAAPSSGPALPLDTEIAAFGKEHEGDSLLPQFLKDKTKPTRKLTANLCADVVGYSRLMGADEEAIIETLTAYRKVFHSHIESHRSWLAA